MLAGRDVKTVCLQAGTHGFRTDIKFNFVEKRTFSREEFSWLYFYFTLVALF